jgi:hypothetical protein
MTVKAISTQKCRAIEFKHLKDNPKKRSVSSVKGIDEVSFD